ncbi:MAG: hypothetical protein ACK5NT_15910 [Pyrinomonadaceae bacterium]
MPILVGIDGTSDWEPGESRNRSYDIAFKNSFVRRIAFGKAHSHYIRGPLNGGGGVVEGIFEGYKFISDLRKALPREPVLLTGYSRGAAEVIAVAQRLKRDKVKVRAMMLFDCVDRSLDMATGTVPDNVEHVLHVIRDPAARSRATFGNSGLRHSGNTDYPTPTKFMCTHGGMGGVYWKPEKGQKLDDYVDEGFAEDLFSPRRHGPVWLYHTNVTFRDDKIESGRVWQFVQSFLVLHGFV